MNKQKCPFCGSNAVLNVKEFKAPFSESFKRCSECGEEWGNKAKEKREKYEKHRKQILKDS